MAQQIKQVARLDEMLREFLFDRLPEGCGEWILRKADAPLAIGLPRFFGTELEPCDAVIGCMLRAASGVRRGA